MLTLSLKLPTNVMMLILWVSRSILLKRSMKRSSSASWSRGLLSRSYWRSSLLSASVGRNRIRHSTKSTGRAFRSNLQHSYCIVLISEEIFEKIKTLAYVHTFEWLCKSLLWSCWPCAEWWPGSLSDWHQAAALCWRSCEKPCSLCMTDPPQDPGLSS